jgi:hypothetical protein
MSFTALLSCNNVCWMWWTVSCDICTAPLFSEKVWAKWLCLGCDAITALLHLGFFGCMVVEGVDGLLILKGNEPKVPQIRICNTTLPRALSLALQMSKSYLCHDCLVYA